MGNKPEFNAEYAVKVAADSWEKLRRCDVYRLFNSHDDRHWGKIMGVLRKKRIDLVEEAREVMADLEADMHSTWMVE